MPANKEDAVPYAGNGSGGTAEARRRTANTLGGAARSLGGGSPSRSRSIASLPPDFSPRSRHCARSEWYSSMPGLESFGFGVDSSLLAHQTRTASRSPAALVSVAT